MRSLANNPPAELATRHIRRVLRRPGLHAFEAAYDPWSRLPEHGHAAPFFTYVLRGSYLERAGHQLRQCTRGAVIFHTQESHTNEVGGAGTVSFNVELDSELWRELTDATGIGTSFVGRVIGGDIEWAALRAWREFHLTDNINTLALEEAVVQLYEAAQRAHTRGLFEPHQRLDRCIAYLDAHPTEAHRLAVVARIAGVHPMHLAKLFR